MSKRRIYIDNSVFGGYYDEEFEDITKAFFTKVEKGIFQVTFGLDTRKLTLDHPENLPMMKTEIKKKFDTVKYFRAIKEKLAIRMKSMTLKEQREFMRKVREGEIKVE